MRLFLAFAIIAWGLFAADEAKAPEISTEQQLAYRRAQVKLLEAQNEMQSVVSGMEKTCGTRQVITDAKGDPICGKESK